MDRSVDLTESKTFLIGSKYTSMSGTYWRMAKSPPHPSKMRPKIVIAMDITPYIERLRALLDAGTEQVNHELAWSGMQLVTTLQIGMYEVERGAVENTVSSVIPELPLSEADKIHMHALGVQP